VQFSHSFAGAWQLHIISELADELWNDAVCTGLLQRQNNCAWSNDNEWYSCTWVGV